MSRDYVAEEIEHGQRIVAGVEVRIAEERWRYGGSSFSVYRVSDGLDLTQEVHGQCFDFPPDDDEIKGLLDGLDEEGVTEEAGGEVIHACPCGRSFREGEEDMVVDHVKGCDAVDGAGRPMKGRI